jgi:hypothetical protein
VRSPASEKAVMNAMREEKEGVTISGV